MFLKNALVLALLLAAAVETDAGHTVRGERKSDDKIQERRIKKKDKGKPKKEKKGTSASSGGGGAGVNRAGGAGAGGAGNRAGGSGSGNKKKGGSNAQPVINRFGTPGGPVYTPQVWSPGNAFGNNLRGSPNIDQNGQMSGTPEAPVIVPIDNRVGGTGPTYNVIVQPNTPGVTPGWSVVNRGSGTIAMTGQHCQSSNPNKFRCCNNPEGSGACAAAGFGNCCDSFRNMCVDTNALDPTALANLRCKP